MLSSTKKKVLQGSAANLLQMLLSFSVSLVVPPFLVHHMAQTEYSAWVLILQISAYVSYLEIGLQTAIGKFIAEYHAIGDTAASGRVASTAFSILSILGALGILVLGFIAAEIPYLFREVPPAIVGPMRIGILAIGWSTALMLPFTVVQGIFVGLQRYAIPAALNSAGRIVPALGIILLLLLHGTLAQMALLIAGFNLLTILAQWYCWQQFARVDVPLHLFSPEFSFDRPTARRLLAYCSVLAIWLVGSLFISGLDTVIVGRYDFRNTGFYGIASSATNFMLLIVGNALGPLMPAVSSVQAQRTPRQLGSLLVRTTRYCVLLIMVLALPLLIAGFPLLRIWIGTTYASGAVRFLPVLVLANVIRQLGYPYALMVVATGTQRLATVSPVVEAIVNLILSLILVRSMGALGVAIGTLIGACVGFLLHLLLSMRLTLPIIDPGRRRLLLQGILRPAICALPSLLVLPWLHSRSLLPLSPALLATWALATLLLAWQTGLTNEERQRAMTRVRALL
jgi:O-antigen/teichoic acid export membrane protein